MHKSSVTIAAISIMICASCTGTGKTTEQSNAGEQYTLMVGSYSEPSDKALRVYRFSTADTTAVMSGALPVSNCSFFTDITPGGIIYALSEQDSATSSVVSVRFIDGDDMPQVTGRQAVGAESPCYIQIVDSFAVTANYNGASAAIFPILPDGTLGERSEMLRFSGSGPVEGRQDAPHPHCIAVTPDGKFMLVNDLGTDRIHTFPILPTSTSPVDASAMTDVRINAGNGPRHIVFNSKGDRAYLINEVSDSVTVLGYKNGILTPLQYIAADTVGAHGAAATHLSPDGRFLYASLRLLNDGIATFSVNPSTGLIEHIGHTPTGGHPRNFTLSPDGSLMLVAARDADAVEIYAIDKETGLPTATGRNISVPRPVCVKFIRKID